jgi:predicted permease
VVAQLLGESLLLALLGGAGGLALALWAVRTLNGISLLSGPTGAPVFLNLQLDVRVLAFTAAVTMLTVLVFGLTPALQATRVDLIAALRGSRGLFGRARSRLQGGLVVLQVTLSFVLLVGAFLLVRSVRNAGTLDVGFDPDQVVVASFDPQRLGYERARADAFYAELLQRARRMPGVQNAALADFVPMGPRGSGLGLSIPGAGADPTPGQHPFTVAYNRVSDGYFATVKQALLRGRDFAPQDRTNGQLVAIVNETMAHRFWPGTDALGQRIRLAGDTVDRVIIGVVRDARYQSFGSAVGPFVFVPAAQLYGPFLTLHVRSTAHAGDAVAALRRLAREIDADLAPENAQTMWERMSFALIPARLALTVIGAAGLIALLLAAGGLYGLVCYTLERRLKEIGIRVSLGATKPDVFRVMVGGVTRLTVIGIVLGTALAAVATRLLAVLLYGLSPTDPLTFAGIGILLLAVTLLAAFAAARRGLNVDPTKVLRME